MKRITSKAIIAVIALAVLAVAAQQARRTAIDVTDYRMDVEIIPDDNRLKAVVDVTFVPSVDTRTVTFELNGSLAVESIERVVEAAPEPSPSPTPAAKARAPKPVPTPTPSPAPLVTFVQDRAGVSALGPSVRVDLGESVPGGSEVTVRFRYSGALVTAEGGPLLTQRMAFIGPESGYLMYGARWFPFNEYAVDRATADVSFKLPKGLVMAGVGDEPVAGADGRYRFLLKEPGLIGNFAYGKYKVSDLTFAGRKFAFFTRAADDSVINEYAETLGRAFEFYERNYGPVGTGRKTIVVQIDDESLDIYSGRDMIFMADRFFEGARGTVVERLQREAAYQWWGLTVGLSSLDDAWISQGLAEFSAVSLRESRADGARLEALRRELLEKSLTFEQTASLARTPDSLDDQSNAYRYLMFGKGPFVFKLLRDTMGEKKFEALLRTFMERYGGRNASIDDFEKLASDIHGENLRYFFARWVEGTGVPEFSADYQIIRTRAGKFITRGTVRQNYDNLRLPVDLVLRSEGDTEGKKTTVLIEDSSADFSFETDGQPIEVLIDPEFKILRISEDLRISSVARRGIELFKEGNYFEAQQQFEAALKLDRSNAWVYYHLGLVYLAQRNYDPAIDNFKVINQGIRANSRPAWLHVWSFIKMGNAYDAKGDRPRALDAYRKAQDLADDYDGAQDIVKRYMDTPYDPKEVVTVTSGK
jgi:tetratricopeptide (TPR) repeat protein